MPACLARQCWRAPAFLSGTMCLARLRPSTLSSSSFSICCSIIFSCSTLFDLPDRHYMHTPLPALLLALYRSRLLRPSDLQASCWLGPRWAPAVFCLGPGPAGEESKFIRHRRPVDPSSRPPDPPLGPLPWPTHHRRDHSLNTSDLASLTLTLFLLSHTCPLLVPRYFAQRSPCKTPALCIFPLLSCDVEVSPASHNITSDLCLESDTSSLF